jgi:hypothetical protein
LLRERSASILISMREFLYKLVERLRDEGRPLSRNKHFHAFEGSASRALRIDRHLRDLEEQLERQRVRGERPRVRALPAGGAQIVLSDPRLQVVRTATLTGEEVELLRKSEAGSWALAPLFPEAEERPAVPSASKAR